MESTRRDTPSYLTQLTKHRAPLTHVFVFFQESVGQLYPALVPSAPSSEAMRIPQPHSAAASAAPAATSSATVPVSVAPAGVGAARAARERGEEVGSSGEVVEELLAENERLRLIIQEMSEEVGCRAVGLCRGKTLVMYVLVNIAILFFLEAVYFLSFPLSPDPPGLKCPDPPGLKCNEVGVNTPRASSAL